MASRGCCLESCPSVLGFTFGTLGLFCYFHKMEHKVTPTSIIFNFYPNKFVEYPISIASLNDLYTGRITSLKVDLVKEDRVSRWVVQVMKKDLSKVEIFDFIAIIKSTLNEADIVIDWQKTKQIVESYMNLK